MQAFHTVLHICLAFFTARFALALQTVPHGSALAFDYHLC